MNRLTIFGPMCLAALFTSPAIGQEFRIETQVYSGQQTKPVSENLTLFTERIVYDFLFSHEDSAVVSEIVIFDVQQNRFVLLDESRELKLEIHNIELATLISSLKSSEAWREKFAFLIEPKFETNFDSANGLLELTSKHMTYSVRTETPEKANAFPIYGQFVDAYAQLNATDPQKLPPFARLELNRELRSRRLMPTEVQMSLDMPTIGLGTRNVSATSKHSVIWQLSKNDRERIETANKHWTQFRSSTLAEYRNLPTETVVRK